MNFEHCKIYLRDPRLRKRLESQVAKGVRISPELERALRNVTSFKEDARHKSMKSDR